MKLYTGIDLHSNNLYITIIDEQDNRILEKRITNSLEKALKELEPFSHLIQAIAVESTFNWYWLVDGLINAGYEVKLVNTVAVQQYSGLKHTDDKSDAFRLAHLMRLNILPTGYIYPPKQRAVRDLLRKRLQLVEDRVRHVLRVQSQIMRSTSIKISTTKIKSADLCIRKYIQDTNTIRSINADLICIDVLNEEIDSIEKHALNQCKLQPSFKRLTAIPGVGTILGMTIMLETGDINRFPKVGCYSSYCRCVSSARMSNNKKKGVNNTKNGNKHLSRAFTEAAYFAARFYDKPKAFFEKKAKQVNRTLATKALAHKLAKATYFVLRDNVTFDHEKLFA